MNRIEIPEKFAGLFEPHRFKVYYGGRDAAKSWSFADALLHTGARTPLRIVCAREFQNSIQESVHHLLEKRIDHYGLPYHVDKYRIYNDIGTEFIFIGLAKQDAMAVKSLEGADRVWVEEAQNVSEPSWKNLIPTVRKEGSEIWVSFNPVTADAPTYRRFITNPQPRSLVVKVNWYDNPWRSVELDDDREHMRLTDPEAYDNVYEGNVRQFAEGAFFREEMEGLERAGRIGDVPYNPNKPVWAFWDLSHSASGKGDPHSITFVQPGDGSGFDVFDHWEGNNVGLPKVVKDVLLGRGYTYAKQILPHDGANVNSHTEKSDQQLVESFGLAVEVQARSKDVEQDVTNVRLLLPRCRFDRERCSGLLASLRNHRQEKDEKSGLWKFKHDWTSHGVSSFRGFSVYQDEHKGLRAANDNVQPRAPRRVIAC